MASKRLIWKDEFGDTHTSVEQINGKFVGDRDVREKLFEYEQEESEGKLIHLPYKIGSEVFVTPDRGKTMTNFEKIKQMSIDEMARSRMFFFDCPYGTPCVGCSKGKEFNNNCTDCTKHWLESEVDTD